MSLTPRGAVFLGISLTMGLVGFLQVDGILITLGGTGLLIVLFAMLAGRWNLNGVDIHLTAPRRIFADTKIELQLTQVNDKALLGSYQVDLNLKLCESVVLKTHAHFTAARSSSTAKLRGSVPNRGVASHHSCEVTSLFPLGLFRFQKITVLRHDMLVFPRAIVPREFFASGQFEDSWNGHGKQPGPPPGEPRGFRPFQAGDRAKQIHWPATIRALARGRNPRVREFDPPGIRPRRAAVIFHSFGTDQTLIRTDLFERALALTCGTLRHLRSSSIPTQLIADFLSWKPSKTFHADEWSETLTALAHARRADHTEAHDLLAEIESADPEAALIIISDMPQSSWQHVIPDRPALLIDIRQHRFGHKKLKPSGRALTSSN